MDFGRSGGERQGSDFATGDGVLAYIEVVVKASNAVFRQHQRLKLNIEVLHKSRVSFNKFTPWLNLIAHKE